MIVEGGGFKFWTEDPLLIAVVRRCAELDRLYIEARNSEVARLRTLRRDVKQIKSALLRRAREAS
jgi:hypothetical protein